MPTLDCCVRNQSKSENKKDLKSEEKCCLRAEEHFFNKKSLPYYQEEFSNA